MAAEILRPWFAPRARAQGIAEVRRSDQRRAAVIALYQHDLTGQPLGEALGGQAGLFTLALAHAAADRADELDAIIARHAHGWTVDRIQPLERSIMRVALIEMLHPDVAPADTPIPPEGAIDEAVQSAKVFCASDAPGFVNGVLAAAWREVRDNADRDLAEPAAPTPQRGAGATGPQEPDAPENSHS